MREQAVNHLIQPRACTLGFARSQISGTECPTKAVLFQLVTETVGGIDMLVKQRVALVPDVFAVLFYQRTLHPSVHLVPKEHDILDTRPGHRHPQVLHGLGIGKAGNH